MEAKDQLCLLTVGQLLERTGSDSLLCSALPKRIFSRQADAEAVALRISCDSGTLAVCDTKFEQAFKAWEDAGLERIQDYAVSCLIETVGEGIVHPEIKLLPAVHDQFSRADRRDLSLAYDP